MKNYLLVLVFIGLSVTSFAIDEIKFETGSWKDIKAKAARENKMIFFDAYASWCRPCKDMEKYVYTDKDVADYYNKNYINVKMDMEEGEGILLSEEFEVSAYPTLLFFSPEGKLLHKYIGGLKSEDFITLGKNALDPARQYYTLKEKALKNQLQGQAFFDWADNARDLEDKDLAVIARNYMKTKSDLVADKDAATIALYYLEDLRDKELKHLYDNRSKIARHMDWKVEEVDDFIYDKVFSSGLSVYERTKNVDSFAAYVKTIIPSKQNYARTEIGMKVALVIDEDPNKAMKIFIRSLGDEAHQLTLKELSNLLVSNFKDFDKSNFTDLHKTLAAFELRKDDKGSENWLYLMQWLAAYAIDDDMAKEFATKAYRHAGTPDRFKTILKDTYPDL